MLVMLSGIGIKGFFSGILIVLDYWGTLIILIAILPGTFYMQNKG